MNRKGGKKDTNRAYMYICTRDGERERERKRQTIDGCHINSGNRCIQYLQKARVKRSTIEKEQMHNMSIITT